MGKAVIHVSTKLLTKLIKLPEGYTVDSVHASSSFFDHDGLSFMLSSDKFPEPKEGEEFPLAIPSYYTDENSDIKVAEINLINMGKGDKRN